MLNYKIIDIKSQSDERGKLSFIQNSHLPFEIKRIFWINTKTDKERGSHAHYKTRQCITCIKGKCRITLDDGKNKEEVILDGDDKGLIIEPQFWHTMHDFSADCILLVLASEEYDEKDHIRSYEKFREVYSS